MTNIIHQFGLIGYPLSHSFSKKYFSKKFKKLDLKEYDYELFPLKKIDLLPELIGENPTLKGLNVTIPYKEKVIDYLDFLSTEARQVNAVNTISIKDQILTGYNTDILGFETSLKELLSNAQTIEKALILGTGGAAKAVRYVLNKMDIQPTMVSRTKKEDVLTYEELTREVIDSHQLIVNTTPLGTLPEVETYPPIPYHFLQQHVLFDLVYNPSLTKFLKFGLQHNCLIKNGLEMLHLQAEKAWEIWMHNIKI